MRLEPDPTRLLETVSEALGSQVFTRVSLLPGGLAAEDGAAGRQPARYWLERARAIGADLLLELELDYQPTLLHAGSSNFWLDFPLFLFPGPFVPRAYLMDVELRGSFFDCWAPGDGERPLGEGQPPILQSIARTERIALHHFQRTRKSNVHLVGILFPAYFLARESDYLAEVLAEQVVELLAAAFASRVLNERGGLVGTYGWTGFHLLPEETRLERDQDGLLRLSATVLQAADDRDELTHWRVRTSAGVVEGSFGDETPQRRDERWLVWTFEHWLPQGIEGQTLSLELQAGSRDRILRTYTLPVPPGP